MKYLIKVTQLFYSGTSGDVYVNVHYDSLCNISKPIWTVEPFYEVNNMSKPRCYSMKHSVGNHDRSWVWYGFAGSRMWWCFLMSSSKGCQYSIYPSCTASPVRIFECSHQSLFIALVVKIELCSPPPCSDVFRPVQSHFIPYFSLFFPSAWKAVLFSPYPLNSYSSFRSI